MDGAAWADLAARQDKLVRLLATSYGPRPRSETEPFDCPSEVANCFAAGRARKSTTWHWPTSKIAMVSVLLDGGPREGGAPSLWVLYRSTTFSPRPE